MVKTLQVDTYHQYNGKNWLGSEVGKVVKTIQVPANASYVTENDRKIVKSGTLFTSPYYGLLVNDVDITDGAVEAALMIRGSYIDANLPTSVSSSSTTLAGQGLYAIVEDSVTRPDFGTVAEPTKLTLGTITASGAGATWSAVTGAIGYAIYKSSTSTGTFAYEKDVATGSYTATASCYIKVKALGDNLYTADSDLSDAKQLTVG